MPAHIYYDDEAQVIHAYCEECNGLIKLPCTPEQLDRYKNGNEAVQSIFPDLSIQDREVLVSGMCGYCYDGTTGFYRMSTPEMDAKVAKIHEELFPEWKEERPHTVQQLWELYCEIQEYLSDYEDNAEPRAVEHLKIVKKALDDFTSQIEDL